MLTYIVVVLVAVAVLYGSFRALGRGETVNTGDYPELLRGVLEGATRLGRDLDGGAHAEGAASVRRRMAGYQQQLAGLELTGDGPIDSARALLGAAVEDLTWAARLTEAEGYADNPGLHSAASALSEHAAQCLDAARDSIEKQGLPDSS